MEYHLQIPQARAYALDRIIEQAERAGVYLKLVVLEKDDEIYQNLTDDGGFVTDRPTTGKAFYGAGARREPDAVAAAGVVALSAGALGLLAGRSTRGSC